MSVEWTEDNIVKALYAALPELVEKGYNEDELLRLDPVEVVLQHADVLERYVKP